MGPRRGANLERFWRVFHPSRDCPYMFIGHLVCGRRLYDSLAFHLRNRLTRVLFQSVQIRPSFAQQLARSCSTLDPR